MSTQKERIFVPGSSAKARDMDFGTVINVSFKAEDLGKFVREHKNDRGYINLSIFPRKETGQYGDTHSIQLDTWEPKAKETDKADDKKPAHKSSFKPKDAPKQKEPANPDNGPAEDDIPF